MTTTFASPALSSSPIAAGSSRGLMAKTMPQACPPQIVRCVSGRFGSTKAMTSSLRMPKAWKKFAVAVMRAKNAS